MDSIVIVCLPSSVEEEAAGGTSVVTAVEGVVSEIEDAGEDGGTVVSVSVSSSVDVDTSSSSIDGIDGEGSEDGIRGEEGGSIMPAGKGGSSISSVVGATSSIGACSDSTS